MAISTNGWPIYAPEGTAMEQIVDAFENDVDLWSKVTGSKLHPYRGQSPRNWVLAHAENHIVYKTGRNVELIKEHARIRRAERVVCDCGRTVARGELSKHRRTAVHRTNLEAGGEL